VRDLFHVQRRASGTLHDRPTTYPSNLYLSLLGKEGRQMMWGVHWDIRIAAVVLAITLTVAIAFFLYLLT
jgi:hypothetical protein